MNKTIHEQLTHLFDLLSLVRVRETEWVYADLCAPWSDGASILTVVIDFSGGGDEGGVDCVRVTYDDGRTTVIEDLYQTDMGRMLPLADLPCWLYGSFAGEYWVDATITLDIPSRKVTVEGMESSEEYVSLDTESFLATAEENRLLLERLRSEGTL